jgi:hypothetical protein
MSLGPGQPGDRQRPRDRAERSALASDLDGRPEPPGGDPNEPGPWDGLNAEYQARFGISPEEATPPPVRD